MGFELYMSQELRCQLTELAVLTLTKWLSIILISQAWGRFWSRSTVLNDYTSDEGSANTSNQNKRRTWMCSVKKLENRDWIRPIFPPLRAAFSHVAFFHLIVESFFLPLNFWPDIKRSGWIAYALHSTPTLQVALMLHWGTCQNKYHTRGTAHGTSCPFTMRLLSTSLPHFSKNTGCTILNSPTVASDEGVLPLREAAKPFYRCRDL